MADGILDYRLQNVISPMQAAMSGFQGIQQMALGRQQSLLLEAQKAAEAAQTAKVEQEIKQAQESAAAVAALYDEIKGGTMRPESVFRVISANPALAQPLEDLKKGITGDQNRALFDLNNDLLTATELGDFERVNAGIDRQIAAYDNAGDQEKAGAARAMKQLLAADPAQFQTALSIRLASLDPDRFKKRTEAIQTYRLAPGEIEKQKGELAQQAAELGLTNAQIKKVQADAAAGSIAAATARINLERARAGGDPAVMTEEQFKAEKDLRGEVTKYTSSRTNARTALTNMRIAAGQNTGSGDIVLVTTFRKMIDEGSVVRETEAAQSEAAQSLLGRAQSLIDQINRGTRLSPQVRRDILAVSESIARQVEIIANDRLAPVRQTIRDYGLEPTRVFGASDVAPPAPVAPAAPAAPAAAPAAPRSQAAQIRARGGNRLPPQQTAPERPRVVNVQPRPKT